MTYLNYAKHIKVSPSIKEQYANFDMIDRYLQVFKEGTSFKVLVDGYFQHLEQRHFSGKIKIRSVRLTLSTAINFLRYCQHCKVKDPSERMLHDYLWCFWGQKASLTGFIHYLNREQGYHLNINSISKPILRRPTNSREILKQQFIQLYRDKNKDKIVDRDKFIRVAIRYLHWIEIPRKINISFSKITEGKSLLFIKLAGKIFYLPKDYFNCK
jgi:hypothetical protein